MNGHELSGLRGRGQDQGNDCLLDAAVEELSRDPGPDETGPLRVERHLHDERSRDGVVELRDELRVGQHAGPDSDRRRPGFRLIEHQDERRAEGRGEPQSLERGQDVAFADTFGLTQTSELRLAGRPAGEPRVRCSSGLRLRLERGLEQAFPVFGPEVGITTLRRVEGPLHQARSCGWATA